MKSLKAKSEWELPWTEKYRPQSVEEVRGNIHVVDTLRNMTKGAANPPHIILAGVSGVGKTTLLSSLAKAITQESSQVREINASEECTIAAISQRVGTFLQTPPKKRDGSLKVVLLDEADGMPKATQKYVCDLMQSASAIGTRFFFTCNDSKALLESIQSRCVMLRLWPLDDASAKARLKWILEQEGHPSLFAADNRLDEALDLIICHARGDLRVAINSLQTVVARGSGDLSAQTVQETLSDAVTIHAVAICQSLLQKNLFHSQEKLTKALSKGFCAFELLQALFHVAKTITKDRTWIESMMLQLAVCRTRLNEGCTPDLQFSALLSTMCFPNA